MENALLSRMPMQRMQAEVLRDSLLQISGQLSQSPFGPPDPVSVRKDGLVTALKGPEGWRRSIYVRQRRSQIPTLLENFDLPQMNPNCVRRTDSTVASQALHLMNNATIEKLASHFAQRLLREAGDNPELRIERAYLLTLSRKPSESELRLNLRILSLLEKRWAEHLTKKGLSTGETSHKALTSWCHTLFCSAGLLYID